MADQRPVSVPAPSHGGPAAPPAPRRSWQRPLAATAAGVGALLVLATAAVVGVAAADGGPPGSWADSPQKRAVGELFEAADALAAMPVVRYVGTAVPPDGGTVGVEARVSTAGSTRATVTRDGEAVQVLAVDGRVFVRGSASYWQRRGASAADAAQFSPLWVEVAPTEFGVDFAGFLAPAALADEVDLAAWDGDVLLGPVLTIGGSPARELTLPGLVVHVTTQAPPRIVRVERRAARSSPRPTPSRTPAYDEGTGGGTGAARKARTVRAPEDQPFLDLSELPVGERDSFYRDVTARLRELAGSVDSRVRFRLVGAVTLSPCSTSRCRANVTLSSSTSSGSPYLSVTRDVRARITVSMTLDGRRVQTCSQERTMPVNSTVRVECWASYYLPPGRVTRIYYVRAEARAVARAVVDTDVRRLERDLLAERARQRPDAAPPPPGPFPPAAARDKVPADWGPGLDNRKGVGRRWADPRDRRLNRIRIERGDPADPQPSQRVDRVRVVHQGKSIGRDGREIRGAVRLDPVNAHIPLSDWLQWRTWYAP